MTVPEDVLEAVRKARQTAAASSRRRSWADFWRLLYFAEETV